MNWSFLPKQSHGQPVRMIAPDGSQSFISAMRPVARRLSPRQVTAGGRAPNDALPAGLFKASGLHPVKLKPLSRGIVTEELVGEAR